MKLAFWTVVAILLLSVVAVTSLNVLFPDARLTSEEVSLVVLAAIVVVLLVRSIGTRIRRRNGGRPR
jgi:hypothetical protein